MHSQKSRLSASSLATFNCTVYRTKPFGRGKRQLMFHGQTIHIIKEGNTRIIPILEASTSFEWKYKQRRLVGFTVHLGGERFQYTGETSALVQFKKYLGQLGIYKNLDEQYQVAEVLGQRECGLIVTLLHVHEQTYWSAKCIENPSNDRAQVTDPNYPKAALWKEIDMHRYITVKLKGSGFLPLREVYQSNHFYYLVCERLKGVPLKHYVNDWQHTVTIIRQLLECVQLMNKHGLIHRDLNPLNVFVEDGSSTIVDFSFTVMADQFPYEYPRCGSPGYIAPEIVALSATYKGPIDPRCDVFSVGCILFELLIGIPLFNANSREALLQVNLECAIDLKFLGGALGDLLQKMLEPNPNRRYTVDECLVHPVFTNVPTPSSRSLDCEEGSPTKFQRQILFTNKFAN